MTPHRPLVREGPGASLGPPGSGSRAEGAGLPPCLPRPFGPGLRLLLRQLLRLQPRPVAVPRPAETASAGLRRNRGAPAGSPAPPGAVRDPCQLLRSGKSCPGRGRVVSSSGDQQHLLRCFRRPRVLIQNYLCCGGVTLLHRAPRAHQLSEQRTAFERLFEPSSSSPALLPPRQGGGARALPALWCPGCGGPQGPSSHRRPPMAPGFREYECVCSHWTDSGRAVLSWG